MSDIFISYASEDRLRAGAVAGALATQGWSVWWDRKIPTGRKFADVIEEEIAKARCIVVLWSKTSIKSDWVIEEADAGKKRGILAPVFIEHVDQPAGFRRIQAADLTDWSGDTSSPVFQELVRDIAALGGLVAKPEQTRRQPAKQAMIAKAPESAPGGSAERPEKEDFRERLERPEPGHKFVVDWAPRAALFSGRSMVLAAAFAVALGLGVFGFYKLWPGRVTGTTTTKQVANPPSQPSGARTNAKDGLSYVWIAPGEFQMGATPRDSNADTDEKPRHRVRITKGFWMAETPVTVAAYKRFARAMPPSPDFNPDWSKEDHPIVRVTWVEAKEYCEWAGGRLPTEAEWEYAARGGQDGLKYPWGNEITPENANYAGSKWKGTSPVRSYPANAWGLYDMAGNVWEGVGDWYAKDYYASLPQDKPADDPPGPQSGEVRVLRGGSFYSDARDLRAAGRGWDAPGDRLLDVGFRCVREAVP